MTTIKENDIQYQFQRVCNDLGWDVTVVLETITWVLEEKRFSILAPNNQAWGNLRKEKELIEIMSKHLEERTARRWTQDEVKTFVQRVETEFVKPVREPISLEAQVQLLFNKEQVCALCGATGTDMIPEIDHRKPAARGGPSSYPNLQWLCITCNRKKGKKVGKEWENA